MLRALLVVLLADAACAFVPSASRARAFPMRALSPRVQRAALDETAETARITALASRELGGVHVALASDAAVEEDAEVDGEVVTSEEGEEVEGEGSMQEEFKTFEEQQMVESRGGNDQDRLVGFIASQGGLALAVTAIVGSVGYWFADKRIRGALAVSAQTAPKVIQQYGKDMHRAADDPSKKVDLHKTTLAQLGWLVRQKQYKLFSSILMQLTKENVSIEMVREFVFLVKLFKLTDNKAACLLLDVCRIDLKSSRERVKILWLGERALTSLDVEGKKSLKKIFKLAQSTNPIGGERSVRLMQRSITVQAFKELARERNAEGTVPSDDEAAVLGVKPEIAAEILAEMKEDEQRGNGALRAPEEALEEKRKQEAAAAKEAKELEELKSMVREDAGDDFEMPDGNPLEQKAPSRPEEDDKGKVLECQECSYTLLIAKGREFKFFGDNFKCPECGCGKNKFMQIDSDGENADTIRKF